MRKLFSLFILILASLSLFSSRVFATESSLHYPVSELGFCRDAKECYLYCEIPANKAACWSYGTYRLGPDVLAATTLSPEEKKAMEAKAKELGITFPVAELGNCSGPQECKDFCEQPANQTTCANFAKSRGLDRGGRVDQTKEQDILTAAQNELGCTTKESCYQKCSQDHAACEAFAKRHSISGSADGQQGGGSSNVDKAKLLEDAKSQLGCTSMETCSQLCQQNPQRCAEFAKQHGLSGGGTQQGPSGSQSQYNQGQSGISGGNKGPGGCDNEASCKAYCQSHPNECHGFGGTSPSSGGNYQGSGGGSASGSGYPSQSSGSYVGPSGCRTQEECAAYCKANPSSCPGFSQGQQQQQYQQQQTGPSVYPSQGTTQYQPKPSSYPQPTYQPPPSYAPSQPPANSSPPPPAGGYTPPPGTTYPPHP